MKVAIVKCRSYALEELISSIKRVFELLKITSLTYRKVLLKINLLLAKEPEHAVTTHPSFVRAITRYLKEAGIVPIIAESSGGVGTTEKAFKVCGISEIAKLERIELLDLEKVETQKLEFPSISSSLELAKPLLEIPIISLPKLKTHTYMLYTGAVKNLFGALPGEWKTLAHRLARQPVKFANLLLDLYLILRPKLAIMDGILAMEANGPTAGKPKKLNLILASEDSLALDFVACKIIGYNPFGVYLIREAIKRALLEPEKIEIVGEQLEVIDFIKPRSELSKNLFPKFVSKKM
jgi:uncharacterized protein (DUF362 family)